MPRCGTDRTPAPVLALGAGIDPRHLLGPRPRWYHFGTHCHVLCVQIVHRRGTLGTLRDASGKRTLPGHRGAQEPSPGPEREPCRHSPGGLVGETRCRVIVRSTARRSCRWRCSASSSTAASMAKASTRARIGRPARLISPSARAGSSIRGLGSWTSTTRAASSGPLTKRSSRPTFVRAASFAASETTPRAVTSTLISVDHATFGWLPLHPQFDAEAAP